VDFWDGCRLQARIVKRDRRRDLAALEVEASGLPAATIGDSNALRVGELVIAVGNPLGFTGAASTGVIHRLNLNRAGLKNRAWVVSQLRLAPGNSGGPLANARGELVGINTMIAGGLAFAIPSHAVAEFLRAPLKQQFWLGLVVQPVTLERSGRQLGFIVMNVTPGSPADRSSLLRNDILVGAGGTRFYSVQDLDDIRANHDGVLELQFRRGVSKNIRSVAVQMAPASVRAA
jgi:serine protease Do